MESKTTRLGRPVWGGPFRTAPFAMDWYFTLRVSWLQGHGWPRMRRTFERIDYRTAGGGNWNRLFHLRQTATEVRADACGVNAGDISIFYQQSMAIADYRYRLDGGTVLSGFLTRKFGVTAI